MELDNSQYRLRKMIGILGIALPILLLLNHDELLSSMSHYYYTSGAVFFIGILVAFGLILFTYQGHKRSDEHYELLSDEAATTLAAICIFITVLVPTSPEGSMRFIHFEDNSQYLFGHDNAIKNSIHLISAGLFLVLLGYMCYFKFTLSPNVSKHSKIRKCLHQICGIIIWLSIGTLVVFFAVDKYIMKDRLDCYFPAYTFWLEMFAIWAFGVSWLVKGRFDRDLLAVFKKYGESQNDGADRKET